MMTEPLRTMTKGDGTKVVERFTGNLGRPLEFDDPAKWEPVLEMKPDEVYAGFVRPVADISVAEHPTGDGVLLEIAGVKFGIPTDILEAALPEITKAIESKKAQRKGG